jgi:hemerythrin-like domain-containing protein
MKTTPASDVTTSRRQGAKRMDLFERLGAEHARIHAVAGALDVFADEVVGGFVDLHELIRFVTFFRGYSDGLHHAREESVLLRCLAMTSFSPDGGPLAHIRDQHRREASLLFQLEKVSSARAPWDLEEYAAIARAAHAFTTFERLHMGEERTLLFPAAERELAAIAGTVREVDERFDRTRAPRWDASWLEALADELVAAHQRP